jgi:PEP-CTERM motif
MKASKLLQFVVTGLIASAACSQAGVVSATNLNLADSGDSIITISGLAAQSGIVQAGFFTSGFDVNAAIVSENYSSLFANFNSLASGTLGDTTVLGPTNFGLYFVGGDYGAPSASAPLGSLFYTFLGSGSTLANSSFIGLIEHTGVTIGADTPAPDSNDLIASSGVVRLGTVGTTSYDFGSGAVSTPSLGLLSVNAIPEPSAALLGAIGAIGLLRRRRN